MAQTSNGSITITDLTDITDVYLEYCMAADSITTAEDIIAKTIWTPPERGWSTEYPTWQSGYQIWIREVTKKEGIAQLEYGTPYLDKAVNQINNNISNIQTKIKKIWSNSTGSYMASGINGNDVIEDNVNTYGFNSKFTTTGISFNYNAIPLTSLTSTALNFYNPSTHEANATLSSNGLVLSKGGIQAGSPNQKGFIYLSSEDYLGDITINNHSPLKKYTEVENPEGNPKEKGWYEKNEEVYTLTEDTEVQQGKVYYQDESDPKWRQIIGNKFGVDSEGNLYAASARIGSDVKIGNETKYHISLADNEIAFWSGEESTSVNKTAYITGNYMYIPYTVVLNEMRVGQGDGQAGDSAKWSWRYIESTENLRLVWLGGDGE